MGTVFMVQFDTLKTSPVAWNRITAAGGFTYFVLLFTSKWGTAFLVRVVKLVIGQKDGQ
jgi:hypothetical protein